MDGLEILLLVVWLAGPWVLTAFGLGAIVGMAANRGGESDRRRSGAQEDQSIFSGGGR